MKETSKLMLFLLLFLLSPGSVFANENSYARIDGFCKKYEVTALPGMSECRQGGCKGGPHEGVEIILETVIGRSVSDCESVEQEITFDGRAYVQNYQFLFDAVNCVIFGETCEKVELQSEVIKPRDLSPLRDYQIVGDVRIDQPSINGFGTLTVDIRDEQNFYRVDLAFSGNIIYKARLTYLIDEQGYK